MSPAGGKPSRRPALALAALLLSLLGPALAVAPAPEAPHRRDAGRGVDRAAEAFAVPLAEHRAAPPPATTPSATTRTPTPTPATSPAPLAAGVPPALSPRSWAAEPAGRSCAATVLATLTPSGRAAQVLMLGVPVDSAESAAATVRTYRPGGIFLRGRSRLGAAVVRRKVAVLQRALGPDPVVGLHIAVDQEGGRVQTLSGPGLARIPAATVQGRWTTAVLEARTLRWASALHDVGVTMNFAPVADTVAPADVRRNPPIGAVQRHYGTRPDDVAEDVAAVTRAMQQAGVAATLKHFPGLGRVRVNTDLSARATDPQMTGDDAHLRPFRAGIEAGADAVMMSSARYPRLDPRRPAAFSPRIVGLLREDLGFTGLIVSDDLGSAAAVRDVPIGRRAVAFIAAGGDLVLTVRRSDAAPMGSALVAEAARSAEFRQRLDDAALHVLLSKYRAGLLRCG